MRRFTSAIIVAAGNSTRMGLGYSKQLIPLCGKPAIEYTIEAFDKSDMIDEIVVVARSEDIDAIAEVAFRYMKVSCIVQGGADRAESVRRGVHATNPLFEVFAIHDGARPLVSQEEIARVTERAYDCGAAVLGLPMTDTVKSVGENNVIESTPDRSRLYTVQTPQVFDRGLYVRAMENARQQNLTVTDDCALVEALGERVEIVPGEPTNIKLTTQSDILLAEALLSQRS